MNKYQRILRSGFVQNRYNNFLAKKAILQETLPPEMYVLTDLDQHSEDFGKKMKDVVICDRCQKDIEDPFFAMLDDSMVYHYGCLETEIFPQSPPEELENVVRLQGQTPDKPGTEE